jgi:hypothetical protein
MAVWHTAPSQALQREKPALLATLRERVLPLLVAAREPLTAGQLAWLADVGEAEVEELLQYLAGLFRWGWPGDPAV